MPNFGFFGEKLTLWLGLTGNHNFIAKKEPIVASETMLDITAGWMQGKMPILENDWFDLVFLLKGQAPTARGSIYYDFARFLRLSNTK